MPGVGKMTQLGKALAHEPGDLGSVLKNHIKKPDAMHICNPSIPIAKLGGGEQKQEPLTGWKYTEAEMRETLLSKVEGENRPQKAVL